MIIKIDADLFLEVKDQDTAEAAAHAIETSLPAVMNDSQFPHGEMITVKVKFADVATDEEIEEHGLQED